MPSERNPRNFFNDPKGYSIEEIDEWNGRADREINDAAEFLFNFLGVEEFGSIRTRAYVSDGRKYQGSIIEFKGSSGNSCVCEVSTPMEFSGIPYVWTYDSKGQRKWAEVYNLDEVSFDGRALFKYLSGRIDEMSGPSKKSIGRLFGDDAIHSASGPTCDNCGSPNVVATGSANLCMDCLVKNNTTGL